MAVSPAITQAEPELRRRYDKAVGEDKMKPLREFRITSMPGAPGKRNYFVADDDGKAILSLGSVSLVPTICD